MTCMDFLDEQSKAICRCRYGSADGETDANESKNSNSHKACGEFVGAAALSVRSNRERAKKKKRKSCEALTLSSL